MVIRLNGLGHDAPQGATVTALLESLKMQPGRVAVELNGRVVARAEFHGTTLREGDVVEVVHFVGGG